MQSAILTAVDLGPDFKGGDLEHEWPPEGDQRPSLSRMFWNEDAQIVVNLSLTDAVGGSPVELANASLFGVVGMGERDPRFRVEVVEAEPPPFGEEPVHYLVKRPEGSDVRTGETIAWRHLEVVVSLSTSGPQQPSVLPYAEKQQAKLLTVFGTTPAPLESLEPVPPIPQLACPGSHPIKALTTATGEKLYYMPMDEGYEEAMADACYGSVVAVEAAAHRRTGDPARRWRRWA